MELPKPTTVTLAVTKITPRTDEVVRNNTMSNDQQKKCGQWKYYNIYCVMFKIV